jgi:hypothetical protein
MACGCQSKLLLTGRTHRVAARRRKSQTDYVPIFSFSKFTFSFFVIAPGGVGVQDSQGIVRCNGVFHDSQRNTLLHFAYFTFAYEKPFWNATVPLAQPQTHCPTSFGR